MKPNMTPLRCGSLWFVGCLLIAALPLQNSQLFSATTGPRVSSDCLECHDGYDTSLAGTAHQLSTGALDGEDAKVACSDCHAADSRHLEDPETFPMANPEKLAAGVTAQVCGNCHQNTHQQNMQERNIHLQNDIACTSCHSIHNSKHASLLRQAESGLCLGCHGDKAGEFAKPYRHPVNDGIIRCSECHMTLDRTRRELSRNGSNVCTNCHAEFAGPFPYEHQATVDYSTQEGACIACHEPHGSYHPRMLNQPYEPPHFQLCLQCHTVPPKHNLNRNHGTMWAGVACNECHTDIHGSYVSRHFLSETLRSQGCINGACHQ